VVLMRVVRKIGVSLGFVYFEFNVFFMLCHSISKHLVSFLVFKACFILYYSPLVFKVNDTVL